MRTLLECQNVNVFESMFKNYVETLKSDPNSRNLGESINQRYGKQCLGLYYVKDIPLSSKTIHLEVLDRIFHIFAERVGSADGYRSFTDENGEIQKCLGSALCNKI
ncbi:hypothetical protein AVEN_15356-1 [Araneus ventricosus]|uniref:Uncharacterized protein n=1 Tax=Araneus ventricosus TaxID=182803 RepID=A0A4Y2UH53_ARAVE|nr:hypothetical protein AVEN_15356-1 [Araneus ventricosus]